MTRIIRQGRAETSRQRVAVAVCLLTAGSLLAAAGCAPPRGRPPAPFYQAAPSSMRELDVSSLQGKRIVIDPGHGGVFRGALGQAGLAEADVNLGVALYLWGLLRDAGAEVLLTRSSDIDFVGGAAGELRQDLARRLEIAASFRPHLFVSLHHNADISRSKDKNQVETYFRMLDDGPSKDAAVLVHARLQERLQIAQGGIVPGNYFVLRNAPCPALLGEPSYITNPWVEDKLKLAEKQLLEAQAYFLGIVEYFSRGVAAVAALAPRDTVVTEARPWLTAAPAGDGFAVDSSSVTCELDGEPVSATRERSTGRLAARPDRPLAGGRHEFCFAFRNSAGNSSGRVCAGFDVDVAPASMSLRAEPAGLPDQGGVLVTAVVSDENANPVRNGTPVVFSTSAGAFARETVTTVAGIASTFFFREGAEDVYLRAVSRGLADSLSLRLPGPFTTCLKVSDVRSGELLAGVEILDGDSVRSVTTPQGLAVVAGRAEGLAVAGTGYVPSLIAEESGTVRSPGAIREVRLRPVALGVLHGARVTLDVGGTPVEPAGRAARSRQGGSRAPEPEPALVSRAVARELEALLKGSGASVLSLGSEKSDAEKVAASERFGAQRYLRMQPATDGRGVILHYPDSRSGVKLAATLAGWWKKVGLKPELGVSEDAHYVLTQTSSPAVVVRMAAPPGATGRASVLRAAYAFYLAILEDLGLDASLIIESSIRASGSLAGEAADMLLDGFIRVPLSKDGSARFFCEEGPHMVSVVSGEKQTAPHVVVVRPAQEVGKTTR